MNRLRLLTLEIRLEHDIVLCRQRARQLAADFGFDTQDQTRIATVVSEIARNAFDHGGGGWIEYAVETARRQPSPRKGASGQTFVISVHDEGPGIPASKPGEAVAGTGLGLTGARQLMDAVEVVTRPGATAVIVSKVFPPGQAVLTASQLRAVVERTTSQPPLNPLAELQLQNQELLRSMELLRERQDEVARINQELAETNTGVLALYDELETLHRVSELLSSQLDLKTLLQAIIDATTDLTEAPFGAFFYRDAGGETWRLETVAGPAGGVLAELPVRQEADFFGADFLAGRWTTEDRLETDDVPGSASKFAAALSGKFDLKSCLVVGVASSSEIMGAMVFGSDHARAFGERSERIVSSIAGQAAVGIAKARLFEKVQSASAAKDRFLAMLSHELRTPLNPVLAVVSDWATRSDFPSEARDDLAVVLRNVRLEARLIDDLLDFSRIVNGKLSLHREGVDLHALIRNVAVICAQDSVAGAQTITLELDAPHAEMLGDAARLQQVLWNVLKNAIKFTPAGGRIVVRTFQAEPGTITITITDSGVGIEKTALPGIFGAFEQGGMETTARFGGLGLGLAIARAFVDLHGGRIGASSAGKGRGTQVAIDLPLRPPGQGSGTPASVPAAPAEPSPASKTLLVVDDHADTLKVMVRLLTRRGYQVVSAHDCRSALAAARENRFELIVSDLGLPDGSGLTLLGQLREIRDVPAIALSGYGMEEDVVQSRAAGYDEHLTKPIDFPQLLHSVDRLVATPKR